MLSASDKREFSCCRMDRQCVFIVLISCFLSFSLSAFNNSCSNTNVTLVSCGSYNSTKDHCLDQGCCWNSSSAVHETQCYRVLKNNQTTSNETNTTNTPISTVLSTDVKTTATSLATSASPLGTCEVYRGEVCDQWLNFTMLEYRLTPRFLDIRFGLNRTEQIILEFMKAIARIDGQDECKRLLRILLCQYFLPPCKDNNIPYNYCREDCEALFQQCNSAMREMLGAAKYILKALGLEFAHIGVPDCAKLRFSDEYEAKNDTCIHWGLFVFTPSPHPSTNKLKTSLFAGAVAGAVVFIIVVITLFVCERRRRNKPLKVARGFEGVTFTAVSMRDRIRAETIRALDESKVLSLFNPDDMRQVPLSSVEYIRDLGSGNFGLVFLGRAYGLVHGKEDAELLVAVKTLKEGSSTETKEDFFKEVALMSLLHHDNIVELLAVSTEEEPYGMIFEFMEHGDLNQYLRKAGPFFEGEEKEKVILSQEDLLSISLQCASGMEHLQTLRFVHRDVATRNCLVGSGMIVKISDFGMSRDIYASDYYKVEGQAVLPIRWMPPEALLLGKFTVESDIYSFGVLLWEIYTLALQPYYGYTNEEVVEFIKKGVHLGQPDDCPDHVYQVMKNCWYRDASQRPNFTLIIAQLKQEDTTQYEDSSSPESPIHDKQPLYQNIGVSPDLSKKEIPESKQPGGRKISQQVQSNPKGVTFSTPSYMNVNPGYHGFEDDDMAED